MAYDYELLLKQLKNALKTAKKLGLSVAPGGGYAMSYDINNPPPYQVGLYGALSIIEGPAARSRLGLTFDETMALEAGFNGTGAKSRKKPAKRSKKFKPELYKLGEELAKDFALKKKKAANVFDDNGDAIGFAAPTQQWRTMPREATMTFDYRPVDPATPTAGTMTFTEPVFVGGMPVRQDIEVLPADAPMEDAWHTFTLDGDITVGRTTAPVATVGAIERESARIRAILDEMAPFVAPVVTATQGAPIAVPAAERDITDWRAWNTYIEEVDARAANEWAVAHRRADVVVTNTADGGIEIRREVPIQTINLTLTVGNNTGNNNNNQ